MQLHHLCAISSLCYHHHLWWRCHHLTSDSSRQRSWFSGEAATRQQNFRGKLYVPSLIFSHRIPAGIIGLIVWRCAELHFNLPLKHQHSYVCIREGYLFKDLLPFVSLSSVNLLCNRSSTENCIFGFIIVNMYIRSLLLRGWNLGWGIDIYTMKRFVKLLS